MHNANLKAAPFGKLFPDNRPADLGDLLALAPRIAELQPDIIVGGPPCQDFSAVGKRIEGQRAGLTVAFAVIVATARPAWFLIENVRQAYPSKSYARARAILARSGYGFTEVLLDASLFGVPQKRKRFFSIGRLGEQDGFLFSALNDAEAKRPMTIRDALGGDVGVHPGGDHPPHVRAFFLRPYSEKRGVRSIDDPAPTLLRSAHEAVAPSYRPHKADLGPAERIPKLPWSALSRLHGFPPDWDWLDTRKSRERMLMIANAVPPPLAEAIGRVIMAREKGESIPAIEEDYGRWLIKQEGLQGPALRNRRSALNRARRLLGGRALADIDAELALLERAPSFAALATGAKSDIRAALRSHATWRASRVPPPLEVHLPAPQPTRRAFGPRPVPPAEAPVETAPI